VEINDDAKDHVQRLGDAINAAVERSGEVADAIQNLRESGYDVELVLKLEIGLRERGEDEEEDVQVEDAAPLELTDEDRRTLRSMKIRFDETE
jgi:hypothetical protein